MLYNLSMLLVENRKAHMEYQLLHVYTAGIVLSGPEVKSLRKKNASFFGSYIKMIGGEAFLLNAQITPYASADNTEYDPKRTRKLLLKKNEIDQLIDASVKGVTIIPLSFEVLGRHIKLRLALAKGKKQFERRAELKKRAVERDVQREMKDKVKMR